MMDILVTGGAGYLGAEAVRTLLYSGYTVTALDNFSRGNGALLQFCGFKNFHAVRGDIRDESLMKSLLSKVDAIFMLAGLVSPKTCEAQPVLAHDVNLRAIELLNQLRSKSQFVVFPSTNVGYGAKTKLPIYTEEAPFEPISVYGKTKQMAEQRLLDFGECVIFRPASAFGVSVSMKTHLLMHYYVQRCVYDKYVVIYERNSVRNFIHVRDLVDGFVFSLNHQNLTKNNIFNIGNSECDISKQALVEKIRERRPDFRLYFDEIGEDIDRRDYLVSNEKIERLGFRCQVGIDDGIDELLRYYNMQAMIDG